MSIQAVAWALEQDVKDPAAKLVLLSLANAFNQQRRRCFPTVRQIMREAGISEMGARRKLKVLVEAGLIRVEPTYAADGRQQANEYILAGFGEGINLIGGGYQIDRGEGTNPDRGEGTNCGTPIKEPEEIPEEDTLGASAPIEPSSPSKDQSTAEPDNHDFERFWAAYPKREGPNPKKPARLAFDRAVKRGIGADTLIAEAKRLAAHHQSPSRFCPQAVTWLNQDRAADAAEAAAPPVAPKVALPACEAEWAKILKLARLQHQWPGHLGPAPDMEGCRAPAHLLTQRDRQDYWRIMGKVA